MDINVQTKTLALMVNLLRREFDGIPPYGYTVAKPPARQAQTAKPLPRSTPEAEGVPAAAVKKFFERLGDDAELGTHLAIVMRHGRVIGQTDYSPYSRHLPHMLYSLSKSVTGTAIGMLIDDGLLTLDEKLVDIFPDKISPAAHILWRHVTVRDVLTMSTGDRFNEAGSAVEEDWARAFLESLPKFEAGADFSYNSLNSYMLAAIVVRKTGMSVTDYLTPRLYKPLGINEYEWEKCPLGIEKGGWGLALKIEDAAKIGQLYLDGGVWNGTRLLSESWVKEASRRQIETPHAECPSGYGYQMWISPIESGFVFNGAFGQFVQVFPKWDAVVASFSGSSKLYAKGRMIEYTSALLDAMEDEPMPANPRGDAALEEWCAGATYMPPIPGEYTGGDAAGFSGIAAALHGREYRLRPSRGSVIPQSIQAVHTNFSQGADMLCFKKSGEALKFEVYEFDKKYSLRLLPDGSPSVSVISSRGEEEIVATRALWRTDGDDIYLAAVCSFIETPHTVSILMKLSDEKVSVTFSESPSLEAASLMLLELMGYSGAAMRRIVSTIRAESLENALRSFLKPSAEGVRIRK